MGSHVILLLRSRQVTASLRSYQVRTDHSSFDIKAFWVNRSPLIKVIVSHMPLHFEGRSFVCLKVTADHSFMEITQCQNRSLNYLRSQQSVFSRVSVGHSRVVVTMILFTLSDYE